MEAEECAMQSLLKSKMINPAGGGRLGARRTEDGLRRDATATLKKIVNLRSAIHDPIALGRDAAATVDERPGAGGG